MFKVYNTEDNSKIEHTFTTDCPYWRTPLAYFFNFLKSEGYEFPKDTEIGFSSPDGKFDNGFY
jgi:hypothetical protein